jgi:[protein-PII] uridylyltransferase
MAINTFVVSPRFGSPPAAELLRQQFILALGDELDVVEALEHREREAAATTRVGEVVSAVPVNQVSAPPRILWSDGSGPGRFIVQVRAADRAGLLARLTAVIERDGLDIEWAKVTTLGSAVVDVFCIAVPALAGGGDGTQAAAVRAELERDLYAVLPTPPKPVSEAS